ncbi:MAG TPA: VWA domain-containing protein [Thermoanaerobaculia bacterium]|nr:VWA domain-containing protein [Thermoanaerobaculia bacterium]
MKRLFSAAALVLASFPLQSQETPRFEEQIDVNVVLVDATVTDRRGRHILGLAKDDFIIKEDGVVQEIASVDYFTNRRLLDSPEEKAKFKVERVRQERYFIFFFDRFLDLSERSAYQADLMQARRAAKDLVQRDLLPEDRVAVAGFDARLKIFTDFTGDKKTILAALDEVLSFGQGLREPAASSSAESILGNIDLKEMMDRTGTQYDALRVLADAVRPIQARKVVMLFSPGVWDVDRLQSQFIAPEHHRYEPMLHALNRANVSVYAINPMRDTQIRAGEDTLTRTTTETGGEYFRQSVSFLVPLRKIENENNGYYLLTYHAKKPKGATGYQKIDVALRNPEFRLKAREGYAY